MSDTATSAEQTSIAVYGDEHGETPGDVAQGGELLRELHELIDNAAADGTTRYRVVITRKPEPEPHRLDRFATLAIGDPALAGQQAARLLMDCGEDYTVASASDEAARHLHLTPSEHDAVRAQLRAEYGA